MELFLRHNDGSFSLEKKDMKISFIKKKTTKHHSRNHLPSCITVFNFFDRKKRMIAAIPDIKTNNIKNSNMFVIS